MSLSHNGILFLDEFPEFAKNVLQVLRQPMEDGCVTIARATGDADLTLPVGRYRVVLTAEGHAPAFRRVTVSEEPGSLRIAATPIPTVTALLLVSSGALVADVRLDGRTVGRTPLRFPGVRPGAHVVEVSTDGDETWRARVELEPGEARHVRALVGPR